MKSVIQEGSSLAKAIEQGWIKAGKPREFTIKIFQEAKKNFFGITTVAAKVGIFFKENIQESKEQRSERRPQHQGQRQHRPQQNQQYRQQPKKRFYKDKRDRGPQNRDVHHRDNTPHRDSTPYRKDNESMPSSQVKKTEDKE